MERPRWLRGLGPNVVFLGVVSGLTDISSEMLYPVMPLFLTGVLHAPMTVVGLIEGAACAAAAAPLLLAFPVRARTGRGPRGIPERPVQL